MATIVSFRDLDVWRESMALAERCYLATRAFPQSEQFGLTAQIRRAAVSIPSNIAEGHRRSKPAFLNHVRIALGSHAELETQLELAVRLKLGKSPELSACAESSAHVGRLLHGLARSLGRDMPNP